MLAVITGGAGGMGFACAQRLGRRQPVLLTDVSESRLRAAVERLQGQRIDATGVVCDIANAAAVDALADEAADRGELGALVHAAGISPSMTSDPRSLLEVNLVATATILDAFHRLVTVGTAGVCIASISSYREVPPNVEAILREPRRDDFFTALERLAPLGSNTRLAYALSKYGVRLLCEYHARDWGQRGARLCSLSPGGILTPMGHLERHRGARALVENTALGRRGSPHEIASVVDFLCGPDASYVTGIDIPVDGGVMAGYSHHASAEIREAFRDATRLD